jgi:cell division protein ZapE
MLKEFFRPVAALNTNVAGSGTGKLESLYQEQIDLQHIHYDPHQIEVLQQLQNLLVNLRYCQNRTSEERWWIPQFITPERIECNSLYIHGGVGSGKSMLMDMFYCACPIQEKRRVHFHAFMREVHEFIHLWRQDQQGNDGPIPALAAHIRNTVRLLCFDEFHVSDIADAMILGRLFHQLLDLGVIFVATSNRHPDDLYRGGLQRELFLPFIQLLHDKADIVELSAKQDYRLIHIQNMEASYYYPINDAADKFLLKSFDELTNCAQRHSGVLHVLGREVELSVVYNDVALVTFSELCKRPLGAPDYLEIARKFNTLMIARIPRFYPENRNEAKRFVTLIDILYEYKVKLICTAEVPPEELYTEGDGAFEFARTASRLIEMQSLSYLSAEHEPG